MTGLKTRTRCTRRPSWQDPQCTIHHKSKRTVDCRFGSTETRHRAIREKKIDITSGALIKHELSGVSSKVANKENNPNSRRSLSLSLPLSNSGNVSGMQQGAHGVLNAHADGSGDVRKSPSPVSRRALTDGAPSFYALYSSPSAAAQHSSGGCKPRRSHDLLRRCRRNQCGRCISRGAEATSKCDTAGVFFLFLASRE